MRLKNTVIYLMVTLFVLFTGARAYGEPAAVVFRDIKGSFAEAAIIKLAGQGMINGISPEEFGPGENINRLDFAVLMAKTLGIQPLIPAEPVFSDVPLGTEEAGYVQALVKLGLLKGTGEQYFGAKHPVLRQDAAVLLHRIGGGEAVASVDLPLVGGYLDLERVSTYAVTSVAWVTGKGWMTGSNGFFHPLHELTRAEASVLTSRLISERSQQVSGDFHSSTLSREVQLGIGEFREIEKISGFEKTRGFERIQEMEPLPVAKKLLSFTPVYGADNLAVCSVSTNGVLKAGQNPGTGTITINEGYATRTLKTSILSSPVTEVTGGGTAAGDLPSEETELALTYRVEQQEPESAYLLEEYKSYSGPVNGLTSKSDTWTGFLRQRGRDITVDLKETRPVTKISLEFLQKTEWAVYSPKYLQAVVSTDGKCWYQLGYVYHGLNPLDTEVQSLNLVLTFPPVSARYIKLTFPVEEWVFARHLTIMGGKPGTDPVILAPAMQEDGTAANAGNGTSNKVGLPASYMKVPDCKDILLIYTGGQTNKNDWNVGDFLPAVAYLNKNGLIEGRMFDTMLFLPYYEVPCTKDSWTAYLDDLFASGKQLPALEGATALVSGVSGLQGKEKIILTIPYPDESQQDFGQLEKDGPSLSFSEEQVGREQALKNRLAAAQWFYDLLMDKWNKAGFKHLDLIGIYWYSEYMDRKILGEKELVQQVARKVRGNGQNFFWIPFYNAKGSEDWKAYGFTHVFLQPNYYRKDSPPEDRMDKVAEQARKYNTGIEIEFDDELPMQRYYYDLFYKQLNKAHQLGLDGDTTNAYYAGRKAVVTAARSNVPEIRAVYEDLYRWISGTYKQSEQ